MPRLTTTLLLATALVATAACSKKHPEQLPPAPGPAPEQTQPTGPSGPVGDAVVPGSAADFKRSVTSDTVQFALDQYDIDDTARDSRYAGRLAESLSQRPRHAGRPCRRARHPRI